MRTFAERFADFYAELTTDQKVNVFNEFAYSTGNEPINDMGQFDEVFHGVSPLTIACQVRYGDFNPNHDYFTFDGYGNIESLYDVEEYIDDYYMGDMADFFEEHTNQLNEILSWWDLSLEEEEEEKEKETI